ncbi:hypothetical protein GCM10010401_08780 [Rarobacter faecitabidus]|uniref:TrbC/VIRB2 family protein n=1 Tax=Rarobacter faecitabidus TaxID=13243 RepID=A0A542ZAV7_RARFA|nr:hypothetical protein [Rarobacter faecitabidus]TQL57479.1 hypothetical protein FB461_2216 [Rarobacter faecitabidus]
MSLATDLTVKAIVLADKIDPGIKPNTTGIPGVSKMQSMSGAIQTGAVVAATVILIIGLVMLLVAKTSKSNQVAGVSTSVIGWAIFIASLIGGASAIMKWGTGIDWGF